MEQWRIGAEAPAGEKSLRRVLVLLAVFAALAWSGAAAAQSGASQLIQQLGGQAIQVL